MKTGSPAWVLIYATFAGCAGTTTVQTAADRAAIAIEQREQLRVALETARTRDTRLQAAAYPVLKANTALCGNRVTPRVGVNFATHWDFAKEIRAVAAEVFGLSNRVTLTQVTPGSPAEEAGLFVGDILVSLDGEPIPPVETERAAARARRDLDRIWDRALADNHVMVHVERGGEIAPFPVEAIPVCSYSVVLLQDTGIGAFTDGETLHVSTGMLRFTETDLELQTVISHELAHAIEDHIGRMQTNAIAGLLLGAVVDAVAGASGVSTYGAATELGAAMGARAFSQDFEREADYVGLYLLANAGIDTEQAAKFWRRIAVESAGSILYARSHPTSAERFLNLSNAAAEITSKQVSGEPLLPTRARAGVGNEDRPNRTVQRGEEMSLDEWVEQMKAEGRFLGYFRCDQVRSVFAEGVTTDVIQPKHRNALDPDRDGIACEPN